MSAVVQIACGASTVRGSPAPSCLHRVLLWEGGGNYSPVLNMIRREQTFILAIIVAAKRGSTDLIILPSCQTQTICPLNVSQHLWVLSGAQLRPQHPEAEWIVSLSPRRFWTRFPVYCGNARCVMRLRIMSLTSEEMHVSVWSWLCEAVLKRFFFHHFNIQGVNE